MFGNINPTMMVIVALSVAVFILTIVVILLNKKINKINLAYKRTFRKGRANNLEQLIEENFELMENATKITQRATEEMAKLETKMARCIQNVGMVKYRAFQQTGPELSFSLALLDENKDGFVITNLFGKQNCSVYSKPIINGNSNHLLSAEEKEALEIAMTEKPAKLPEQAKKQGLTQLIAATVTNNILK